jgi:hypothetical protein
MSMNGQFRQVSPRAFSILLEQPELVQAAFSRESAAPADSDDPLAGLPASTRAIFAGFPLEAQRAAAAQHAQMMQQMLGTNPMLARMMALQEEDTEEDSATLRAAGIGDADLPDALDIRKTWHGLHVLLGGEGHEPGPGAAQAVLGGRETGDDYVYGPIRVLTPAETAEVAAALAALTEDELAGRYDAEAMSAAQIYGACEEVEWLLEAFRQVRDYYAAARERGYAMLLAIV